MVHKLAVDGLKEEEEEDEVFEAHFVLASPVTKHISRVWRCNKLIG